MVTNNQYQGVSIDSREKVETCLEIGVKKQAIKPVILDIKEFVSYTEFFLIMSGKTDRHVKAIAEAIEGNLNDFHLRPLGVEGKRDGRWICMDYSDVIIHIFLSYIREYYDLEGLWMEAPRLMPE